MAEAKPKILRAAAVLFATRGFHGTTTRSIATKAGVNEGTIFKIFRSKRRLYRETLEWKLGELSERSLPPQAADPRELLKRVIEAREQDPHLMRLILFGVLEAFPEFKKVLHQWRREYYGRLAAIIEQQKEKGAVANDVPAVMAAITLTGLGIYHYLFFDLFNTAEDITVSRSDLMEFYQRLWLHGLTTSLPSSVNHGDIGLAEAVEVPAIS